MGQVKNVTEHDLGEIPHIGYLASGDTAEVDDEYLRVEPFQYPPFEVDGVRRLGPFNIGDDFLEKFAAPAAVETPPAVQE